MRDVAPDITEALAAAFAHAAPHIDVANVDPSLPPFTLSMFTGEVGLADGMWSDVVLSDSHGPELLTVRMNRPVDPSAPFGPPLSCAALRGDSQAACTGRRGPDGEPIMITESEYFGGFRTLSVYIGHTNGTAISAVLQNHGVVKPGQQARVSRATHLLSVDQLIAIMLSPGVTLSVIPACANDVTRAARACPA